eukprot:191363-Rhodomonas_salina.1
MCIRDRARGDVDAVLCDPRDASASLERNAHPLAQAAARKPAGCVHLVAKLRGRTPLQQYAKPAVFVVSLFWFGTEGCVFALLSARF